jgi:hypothetical protein
MNSKEVYKRLSPVNNARVIQVVEVVSIIGEGVKGDPIREVIEYFDFDGVILARHNYGDDLGDGNWYGATAPQDLPEETK